MSTFIFGHRNPDSDSITSTLALANLKNEVGYNSIPCMLGNINKETKYILDYFQSEAPHKIDNVKTQIRDLDYDKIPGISLDYSILKCYKLMESNKSRILPVISQEKKLLGIVTMKDIAMGLIKGDLYHIHTTIENIVNDLEGEVLFAQKNEIKGRVTVIAQYSKTVRDRDFVNEDSIVIVGDRFEILNLALEYGVQLIILTGNVNIPKAYIQEAKEKGVSIIRVPKDTYTTSKLINQCNLISSIMISEDIIKFNDEEYLDEVKEDILSKNHTNYPITNKRNHYLGMMNKRHLLHPDKKKVILVDHNEYAQSAKGLHEAEIMEIIDHHKLGDISTTLPIHFRNMPVGSTCTLVYNMYFEYGVEIDEKMAGLLIAGILSDTLALRSPTTTEVDRSAVNNLNKKLNLNIQEFSMNMFKAGSSLEGQSAEEIFHKDYKAFHLEGLNIGIAQVFTMDIDEVFARKEEFISYIKVIHQHNNHFLTLLIVTDILKEGSYVLYECDNSNLIPMAFDVAPEQGVFVKGILSRKKQIIPQLIQTINMIK